MTSPPWYTRASVDFCATVGGCFGIHVLGCEHLAISPPTDSHGEAGQPLKGEIRPSPALPARFSSIVAGMVLPSTASERADNPAVIESQRGNSGVFSESLFH